MTIKDRIMNVRYEGVKIAFDFHTSRGWTEKITIRESSGIGNLHETDPEQARQWIADYFGDELKRLILEPAP